MPGLERYNQYFGGERGSAQKTLEAMQKTYGKKGGERVFWGTVEKRKRRKSPRRWW